MFGVEIRRRRKELGLTGAQLAAMAAMAPSAVSQIETGKRTPSSTSVIKLAAALGVDVGALYPEAQAPLPLEYKPSLEELHGEARCETDWLIKPEDEWRAAWSRHLNPPDALRIVDEMAAEIRALKPLMNEQEQGQPWSQRMFSGRYKQAWQRYIDGLQAAHNCGVAAGLIGPEGTPTDMAEKLGGPPVKSLEQLGLAS